MASPPDTEQRRAPARLDPLEIMRDERVRRRSPRRLLNLAPAAIKIARAASPRLFLAAVVLSVASALLLAAQVLLSKLAVSAVLGSEGQPRTLAGALPPVVGLLTASALTTVSATAQTHLLRLLGERVQQLMWASILAVTTSVELKEFEGPEFFDDLQRVRTNALTQPAVMTKGLLSLMSGVLSFGALMVGVLIIQPLLVPILLLGAAPLWLLTRRSSRMEFDFQLAQTPLARLRFYLVEILCGRNEAKEIRAFDLGDTLLDRWRAAYATYQRDLVRHVRRRLLLATLSAAVLVAVTSLAVAFLLYLVFHDRLSVAEAAAALIAIRLMARGLESVFSGVGSISEAGLFVADYERFLARNAPPPREPGALEPFQEMRFENVSFTYPGGAAPVLNDVSLTIRAGETIALVGENGSGKTTLAKILAQLFAPSSGRILWDGVDTATLQPQALREHIGVIFQDFIRYQLSARENVQFGRTRRVADLDAVRAAARASGADEFLSELPHGYDTGLGKEFLGGHDLSVGQWQRVALARAFFRDAACLVLDEPTASVDARTERALFDRVRELARGRSLLLISHRFSTVMSADRIYVLEGGWIVEEGSHSELIALNGRYAEMFEMQARSYR